MTRTVTRALCLIAPLPAVVAGSAVAAHLGVPWNAYLPNLAGLVVGIAFATCAWRIGSDAPGPKVLAAVVLAIVATLAFPGIDGVNRWVFLGPVRLNASAALSPLLLLGLSARAHRARALASAAVVIAQLGHVLQPDVGQATALAAGALPLVLARLHVAGRWTLAVTLIGLAAATWLRDDPLVPVAHVEGTLELASSMGTFHVGFVLIAVSCLLLPFVVVRGSSLQDEKMWAALGYLFAAFVVTVPGHFPVPVFGAGAGPVLGWYGLLILSARGPSDDAVSP